MVHNDGELATVREVLDQTTALRQGDRQPLLMTPALRRRAPPRRRAYAAVAGGLTEAGDVSGHGERTPRESSRPATPRSHVCGLAG